MYTKRRGEFPDFEGGLILKKGCAVEDVCKSIHRSLVDEFKVRSALISLDFNLRVPSSRSFGGRLQSIPLKGSESVMFARTRMLFRSLKGRTEEMQQCQF